MSDVDEMADAIAEKVVDRLGRPPQLLKVAEVASRLGVGERTVRDLMDRGVLASLTVGVADGARRIEASVLEAYIADRRDAAA